MSNPHGLSFTEWEYQQSRDSGRPVIAFLLEAEKYESSWNSIIENTPPDERGELYDEKEHITKFRTEIEQRGLVRYFRKEPGQESKYEPESRIAIDCINSINEAINSGRIKQDAGWIRARSRHAAQLRRIERNRFLKRILESLYEFSTLTKRIEAESDAKQCMAQLFWEVMYGRIRRRGYRDIFFESGSTLAYVSEAFEEKARKTGSDNESAWQISTNNALTLLQLLLHANMTTIPLPPAPPEDYYGAMFGHALLEEPQTQPSKPRKLYKCEKEAVDSTVELLKKNVKKRLFLATASGLDLTHDQPNFRGPHVGSHPNMLFKRAIFETNQPVILFFTEEKTEHSFEAGKCFPVFGPDRRWTTVMREYPLAICVGYHKEGKSEILEKLKYFKKYTFDLNYAHMESQPDHSDQDHPNQDQIPQSTGMCIIANDEFKKVFPKE